MYHTAQAHDLRPHRAPPLTLRSPCAPWHGLWINRIGKWTLEHVVDLLCQGEPPEISGPILVEATSAAAEYNLPTPHLDIEGNMAPSQVSLLNS